MSPWRKSNKILFWIGLTVGILTVALSTTTLVLTSSMQPAEMLPTVRLLGFTSLGQARIVFVFVLSGLSIATYLLSLSLMAKKRAVKAKDYVTATTGVVLLTGYLLPYILIPWKDDLVQLLGSVAIGIIAWLGASFVTTRITTSHASKN